MIHSNILTVQERFWSKVNFNGPVPPSRPLLGPCHIWTGSLTTRGGYGQFRLDNRVRKAHQVSLELTGTQIPDGLEPDHLCRNPACVRVSHLELVTRRENVRRGTAPIAAVMRTNYCMAGLHELTPDNTLWDSDHRRCRACREEYDRVRNMNKYSHAAPACRRGHLFTPENTIVSKRGRSCRACKNLATKERLRRSRKPKVKSPGPEVKTA